MSQSVNVGVNDIVDYYLHDDVECYSCYVDHISNWKARNALNVDVNSMVYYLHYDVVDCYVCYVDCATTISILSA